MQYKIQKTASRPEFIGHWDYGVWQHVPALAIDNFHPRNSQHHPQTKAKLLYDDKNLYIIFQVIDQYVRAVYTTYQEQVCNDSCVEFFVQPDAANGYFNFEVNCIGTLLLNYIEDPTRTADGFASYTRVPASLIQSMTIFHSLSGVIDPEISTPTDWIIEYNIPFTVFEAYVGPLSIQSGMVWRGNFYKCGDQTSHPHWSSWSPIGSALNFHQPEYFGELAFDNPSSSIISPLKFAMVT